jgi:hypothetical protein
MNSSMANCRVGLIHQRPLPRPLSYEERRERLILPIPSFPLPEAERGKEGMGRGVRSEVSFMRKSTKIGSL